MTPIVFYPGSIGTEIVLWILLPVGLLYSLWRHIAKKDVCPVCKSADVVPAFTPRSQELLARYHSPTGSRL